MASNRIGRINEEIRKELSALLRTVKDPRVAEAMLTITPPRLSYCVPKNCHSETSAHTGCGNPFFLGFPFTGESPP